jgi:hypothetical protein
MNLPAFAGSFSQEKAVKPSPVLDLPGVSDIDRLAPPKFLAPSAQPFEPGPGAFPLASGIKQLFAAWLLARR